MNDERRHNDDAIIVELRAMKEFLMLKISNSEEELKLLREQLSINGERIRVMEIWQSNSMGKMAIIFTIIGMLVTALFGWVARHF